MSFVIRFSNVNFAFSISFEFMNKIVQFGQVIRELRFETLAFLFDPFSEFRNDVFELVFVGYVIFLQICPLNILLVGVMQALQSFGDCSCQCIL